MANPISPLVSRVAATVRARALEGLVATEPGRSALEWWSHQRAQVYLLSFPKCGRTWLRLLIGKALDEGYGLGVDNPMAIGAMHRLRGEIPRIRVSHEDPWLKAAGQVERDKRRYAAKRVLFLVRDPRDVVVSTYFEKSRRRGQYQGELRDFLRHPIGSLDTILAYYNAWADARRVPRELCLLHYEALHADPHGELGRALAAMGLVVPAAAIAAAVEYSRFENMRKLEEKDAMGSRRLRPGDASDRESFKTRRGKMQGYRDYLDQADIAWMNQRIADRLSPFYARYLGGA